MNNTYRAAIVGLGNIAWRFDHKISSKANFLTHAYALMHNAQTVIAGGCSPDENDRCSFEKTFSIPTFSSLEELSNQVEPDIVCICSPSEFHFEQVIYCLEQGVPMIWLEKPPTSTVHELDCIIAMIEKQNIPSTVLVNYQRRYSERYRNLKSIYQEKTFGECRRIHLTYARGLETNGSHIIDMLFYIVGDFIDFSVEWVSAFGDPENPSFVLNLENNLEVIVSGISVPYHCLEISIAFESGRVSIFHGGMTTVIEEKVEHELFPGFHRLKECEDKYQSPGAMEICMERSLEDLIRSYELRKRTQSSLWSARSSQIIIDQVRESQRKLL